VTRVGIPDSVVVIPDSVLVIPDSIRDPIGLDTPGPMGSWVRPGMTEAGAAGWQMPGPIQAKMPVERKKSEKRKT
jgi:hypothetical protein